MNGVQNAAGVNVCINTYYERVETTCVAPQKYRGNGRVVACYVVHATA